MITLKFKVFKDTPLMSTMAKLYNHTRFPTKTAYAISKIAERLEKEATTIQELWLKMTKKFAELDAKGEFVPLKDPQGAPIPGTYSIPEDKRDAYKAASEEFNETELTIDRHKLSAEIFEPAGIELSPRELSALEPVLHLLEPVTAQEEATVTSIKQAAK